MKTYCTMLMNAIAMQKQNRLYACFLFICKSLSGKIKKFVWKY